METIARRPKPVVGGILLAVDAVLLYLASISPFGAIIGVAQHLTSGGTASTSTPTFFRIIGHPAFLIPSLLFSIFAVVYSARSLRRDNERKGWWIAFLVISCLILIPMFGSVLTGLAMGGPLRQISGTLK